MEKDRKEFQLKMANVLTESMGNQTRLQSEQAVFIQNVKNGSHLYIDPLVDTVKKTLKQKNPVQTKFNALMLLKDSMDTRNKELAKYVTTKILDRLKAIAKQSLKADKNKLFTPAASGDEFYLLLLECLYNWSIFFQLPADQKMEPSAFKIACSDLQQAGIRFPTTFKYFQIIEPQQQKKQEQQQQLAQKPKQQEVKKQEKPKQQPRSNTQIQTPTPESSFKKGEETCFATKGLLSIVVEILRENEDISYVLEFTEQLQQIIEPIENLTIELSAEDTPKAEILVGDLIQIGEYVGTLIKDLNDCQRKQMSLGVLQKKYQQKLQQFIDSLQYQEQVGQNEQKVEEPKTTFQQEVIQASQKPLENNDNPFVFNQVANFDQQEIEKTQQELLQQKLQLQQQQQQVQQPSQQKISPSQPQQLQQTPTKVVSETLPEQQQPEIKAPFGFDQFGQQVLSEQNQPAFDTQWGAVATSQPQALNMPFGQPEQLANQEPGKFDLPFDQKRVNTETESQNRWEIKEQQPQNEWNPGWQQWQGQPQDQQMDEEVVEKTKPTLPPPPINKKPIEVEQPQQAPRKKKNNPFERQSSRASQGDNQNNIVASSNPWATENNNIEPADTVKSEDGFAGFSKVMDNKSEYKTEVDSKPFSNIFAFGDDLGDLNLENMAGSSKISKQDRSKSFESEQAKSQPNQFFQPNIQPDNSDSNQLSAIPTNQWAVGENNTKKITANQFGGFPFIPVVQNKEQDDDFVDPYQQSDQGGWKIDQFETKPRRQLNTEEHNLSNIHKNEEKSDCQDSPNPFKNSNDFQFDLSKLPKHSVHVMNARILQLTRLPTISLNYSIHNRKVDAEVQVAEQLVTLLKYNPQQEKEHQKEKQQLIKELQELRYLKCENEQDLKDQKKIIENYQQQFKLFKQFEQKMTDAYKQLDKQFSSLNEHYKQLKQNNDLSSQQIEKISKENVQLNEVYTSSIKELSDSKSNEESLMNRLRIIEKQFQSIKLDHKCPIQLYLQQYIKSPNLIETEMPIRLSLIQNQQQEIMKTQKQEIKYDQCLFMDILRGCVQPFSTDINDLKYSLLLPRAILYEDSILQIGVITKLTEGDLSVQLHIKNKSDKNLVIQKIKLVAPSNNQINKLNVQDDSVLQKRSTFKIALKFQFQEQMKQPILEFSANNQDYHILLPVSLMKFGTSELIDVVTIREKWKENKYNKIVVKSVLEQPNPKFICQLKDFKRYFSSLVEIENSLIMEVKIDQFEFGVKFKIIKQQLIFKVQASSLLRIKVEQLTQHLLFLFNL